LGDPANFPIMTAGETCGLTAHQAEIVDWLIELQPCVGLRREGGRR